MTMILIQKGIRSPEKCRTYALTASNLIILNQILLSKHILSWKCFVSTPDGETQNISAFHLVLFCNDRLQIAPISACLRGLHISHLDTQRHYFPIYQLLWWEIAFFRCRIDNMPGLLRAFEVFGSQQSRFVVSNSFCHLKVIHFCDAD